MVKLWLGDEALAPFGKWEARDELHSVWVVMMMRFWMENNGRRAYILQHVMTWLTKFRRLSRKDAATFRRAPSLSGFQRIRAAFVRITGVNVASFIIETPITLVDGVPRTRKSGARQEPEKIRLSDWPGTAWRVDSGGRRGQLRHPTASDDGVRGFRFYGLSGGSASLKGSSRPRILSAFVHPNGRTRGHADDSSIVR